MIRLIYAMRRRADLSLQDFQAHWEHAHAPLYLKQANGFSRYIQFHTLRDPAEANPDAYRGKMAKPYDGVTELWFADSESVSQFINSDLWQQVLFDDEKSFVTHAESAAWLAYDCPQVNPTPENVIATADSSLVKLFYLLKAPQGWDLDEIQWYWRVQHGPLVRSVAADIQTLRYIQVHRINDPMNQQLLEQRGLAAAYYGHAELWFDSERLVAAPKQAETAARLLYEDESRFIDFGTSTSWIGKELVVA